MHCSEETETNKKERAGIDNWQVIIGDNAEIIGYLYSGGYEQDFINYNYPEIHVYIKRDGNIIDLSSANLKLNIYTYDLKTNTKGSLEYDISKEENENFFKIAYENMNIPYGRYCRLSEYDETTNNFIEYEFDTPVVGYESAGTEKSTDIYLNITSEEEKNKGTIEKIIDMLKTLVDFVTGFFDYLMGNLKEALEIIFIPSDEFLQEWTENIKIKIDEKVPILSLPFQILEIMIARTEFVGGTLEGMHWGELQFMGKVIIPAGNFSFYNLVQENKAIKDFREYGLLFTDFILCMFFVKYIKRKLEIVFGKD